MKPAKLSIFAKFSKTFVMLTVVGLIVLLASLRDVSVSRNWSVSTGPWSAGELEMVELTRRINELSKELGRETPFALAFLNEIEDGRP